MPLQHEDDPVQQYPVPEWGVDIKCGKGTGFSYGPWADRQREGIFKFFFPPDYQPMKVMIINYWRPIPKKTIVLKIVLRFHFDFKTCPNY